MIIATLLVILFYLMCGFTINYLLILCIVPQFDGSIRIEPENWGILLFVVSIWPWFLLFSIGYCIYQSQFR